MVAFSVFGYSVYWYGIFYFFSFILVYLFLKFIAKLLFIQQFPKLCNLLAKNTEDILLYAVAGVLIGGRLGYVLVYEFAYYWDHPLKILALHEGGMSFIGGIIGVVSSVLLLRWVKKLSWTEFWVLFDSIVVVVPLGIMLGRLGNYLNQEIYGIIVNPNFLTTSFGKILSSFNFIHVYPHIDLLPRFNTNLIAIVFEGGIIFFILLRLFFRRINLYKVDKNIHQLSFGLFSGLFLVMYSFFRFFIEYLRQDSQSEFLYFFTKSQWFFILFFLLGFVFILNSERTKK